MTDKDKVYAFRMDKDLRNKLEVLAEEDCCKVANIIRKACIRYIKERGY